MPILDDLRKAIPGSESWSDKDVADYVHQRYAPDMEVDQVYSKLGVVQKTKPNALLAMLPKSVESGFRDTQIGTNAALLSLGFADKTDTANRVAELQRRKQEIAPDADTQKGLDEITAAGKEGWLPAIKAAATNPKAVGRLAMESVGSFLPDIALAVGTGGVVGPAAKTLATRIGVTRLAPEAVGLAAKTAAQAVTVGVGSAKTEYGSTFLETLKEAGVDLASSKDIRAAFNNEELMAKAREESLKKGIPVGLFDAVSMGVAGKFYSKLAGQTLGSKALGSGAEFGVQAGLGMSGETAGQLLQKGEITDRSAILMEGLLEGITAGPEAALNLRNKGKAEGQLAERAQEVQQAQGAKEAPFKLTDEQRVALELPGTAQDVFIKKVAEKYGFNEEQIAGLLNSTEEEKKAFVYEVAQADPQLLNEYARGRAKEAEATYAYTREEAKQAAAREYDVGKLPEAEVAAQKAQQGDIADRLAQLGELPQSPKTYTDEDAAADPGLLEINGIQQEILANRQKERDRIAGEQEAKSYLQSEAAPLIGERFASFMQTEEQPRPQESPKETIPEVDKPLEKSVVRALGAMEQGQKINIGVLQGQVTADLGRTPTFAEMREALKGAGRLVVQKGDSLYRALGTYFAGPAPVRGERDRNRVRIPASMENTDKLRLGNSTPPAGMRPETWQRVVDLVNNTPTNKPVTVPRLVNEAGLTNKQAQDTMKRLREEKAIQGALALRTQKEMPNTLSVENATKMLKSELNGKAYGC